MTNQSAEHYAEGQTADSPMATHEIDLKALPGPWVVQYIDRRSGPRQVPLQLGQRVTIGSRQDADIQIEDPCVSGVHCQLDASRGQLELIDMGSKNGVFLGHARISKACLSGATTTFTIGKTVFSLKVTREPATRGNIEPIAGLIGRSEPIVRLTADIRRLAKLKAPVLIVGETGVGKDVVAQALHHLSGRSGQYVPLNVATIPESLADSELFGHCRGAFTGASQPRTGAFELANAGTLFLDEIGELVPAIQAKLLRVLEDGVVRPVGAAQGRATEVRVVSATCAPLAERCANGQFRFDLLQRLSVVTLEVPPLRERRSDIPLLAQAWLERYRAEVGIRGLGDDALAALVAYDWPGNVRELGAVIYRSSVMADSSLIDKATVERALQRKVGVRVQRRSDPHEFMVLAEGNVSMAARLAGLPRTTFRTWLSRSDAPKARENQAGDE